jgi:hypothetical protein
VVQLEHPRRGLEPRPRVDLEVADRSVEVVEARFGRERFREREEARVVGAAQRADEGHELATVDAERRVGRVAREPRRGQSVERRVAREALDPEWRAEEVCQRLAIAEVQHDGAVEREAVVDPAERGRDARVRAEVVDLARVAAVQRRRVEAALAEHHARGLPERRDGVLERVLRQRRIIVVARRIEIAHRARDAVAQLERPRRAGKTRIGNTRSSSTIESVPPAAASSAQFQLRPPLGTLARAGSSIARRDLARARGHHALEPREHRLAPRVTEKNGTSERERSANASTIAAFARGRLRGRVVVDEEVPAPRPEPLLVGEQRLAQPRERSGPPVRAYDDERLGRARRGVGRDRSRATRRDRTARLARSASRRCARRARTSRPTPARSARRARRARETAGTRRAPRARGPTAAGRASCRARANGSCRRRGRPRRPISRRRPIRSMRYAPVPAARIRLWR